MEKREKNSVKRPVLNMEKQKRVEISEKATVLNME